MADMKLVPVEPTEAMIEAMDQAVFTHGNVIDAYRAMLTASPQAPARECAWCDGRKTVQTASTDVTVRCGHCNGTGLEAALTPREEAPAEGAGEREMRLSEALIRLVEHFERVDAPNRDKEAIKAACDVWASVKVDKALRARTSEPEAREAVPGNVYWSADGQNFYRMDTRAGCGLKFYAKWRDRISEFPTEPHPAPASADKLRVAVEALEEIVAGGSGSFVGLIAEEALEKIATLSPKEGGGE